MREGDHVLTSVLMLHFCELPIFSTLRTFLVLACKLSYEKRRIVHFAMVKLPSSVEDTLSAK